MSVTFFRIWRFSIGIDHIQIRQGHVKQSFMRKCSRKHAELFIVTFLNITKAMIWRRNLNHPRGWQDLSSFLRSVEFTVVFYGRNRFLRSVRIELSWEIRPLFNIWCAPLCSFSWKIFVNVNMNSCKINIFSNTTISVRP